MSLKPIEPKHYSANDVDPGTGNRIANEARSMNHYGASQQRKRRDDGSMPPDVTGGMRAYAQHDSKPPHDKRTSMIAIAAIAVVAVALIVGIAVGVSSCSNEVASNEAASGSVTVTIPSGYGSGDIAQLLRDNGLISSTTEFIQAVQQHSAASSLKAGTYTFEHGATYAEIVDALVKGSEASGLALTIPEGYTVAQTAQRVAETLGISYDEFMAQAKASNYVGEYAFLSGAYNDSLEGFLFPKTYTFESGATADAVIRAMLSQFASETSAIDWTAATQGGVTLSQYEVVTMASLIERETAQQAERPTVASVIFNRLNAGMQLQIDATIAYALNKSDLLSLDDLQVDSPYNTYLNYGLTPGPICSPSLSAIQAVVAAESTGYYYYVAAPTLDGSHVFCETYDEFEVARNEYNVAAGLA